MLVALLVLAGAAATGPLPPYLARTLVAGLAPAAGLGQGQLVERFEAHGLVLRGTLADGRPSPRGPRVFDAARIVMLEARDSAAAQRACGALAHDPSIAWVEPLQIREPCALTRVPDDPLFPRQWGLARVAPDTGAACARVMAAWARDVGANDLLLAVADTGIDPAHPDLAGPMPDGEPRIAWPLNVTGREPTDAWADSFGHGTPVAGVMAARTNDGPHFDSLGVAGVCGGDGAANAGCRIVPIKITSGHSGYADTWSIARAILHAADVGARAINISFAGTAPSRVERLALADAMARGCVPVCAAGNRGTVDPTQAQYPAAYAADGVCIAVGASDALDQRAVFSSYGPGLDVLAPGVDIWTTFMTYPSAAGASYPGYVEDAGTSFAAPFVTGCVGLMGAARPELVDTDLQHVIRLTAHDLGPPGWDAATGWGRLDVACALARVDSSAALVHGQAMALTPAWRESDTLVVTEDGLRLAAQRVEMSAAVPLGAPLAGGVAWARVTGTTTARAGFRLPWRAAWADASIEDGMLRLTGDLYALADGTWWPVPPESARIAFTVLAPPRQVRVRHRPFVVGIEERPAGPLPALRAPPGARAHVYDIAGRRVRTLDAGHAQWDARDDDGRRVAPGIYLVRVSGSAQVRRVRAP